MKKNSRIWILIVSIVLIVLAFVLVAFSVKASYHTVTYDYGFGHYRSVSIRDNGQSRLLKSFGNMCFILGIAGVFLYVVTALAAPKTSERPRANKEKHKTNHTERVKDAEDAESTTINEENPEERQYTSFPAC